MIKVLIAEDDLNILKLLKLRIENVGYSVSTAENGFEALKLFENDVFDLIIVDAMMPKMSGFDFIKEIRAFGSQIPVIMVTAKSGLSDKTQGFDAGIDDYMVKPIEFDELLLRIKALLRRAKIVSENRLAVGNIVLDNSTLTISSLDNLKSVILTKREFAILFKLLSYPEKSFTKGQLFDEFWGLDSPSDDDTVKVFINRIRTKIKVFDEIDIATIRGIGYRGVKNEK